MKIYVNDEYLEGAFWQVRDGNQGGILTIDTNESLAELEEKYSAAGITVKRYNDDDTLIDEWRIITLDSISYVRRPEGNYTVNLSFGASKFAEMEMEEISDAIDDSEMSVLELATYCATIEENVSGHETLLGELRKDNEHRCDTTDERVNTLQQEIVSMQNQLNTFADRIAVLENKQV